MSSANWMDRNRKWIAPMAAGLAVLLALAAAPAFAQEAMSPEEALALAEERAGEGFSPAAAWSTLQRRFNDGGTTMWFLMFLSVLALAFVLERFVRLRRSRIAPPGLTDRLLRLADQRDHEGVRKLLHRRRRSTLGKVAAFIFEHRHRDHEQVNAAIGDIAARDISKHQMLAYPLAAIATLAPLLGLFGTIIGMIESFEVVAIAGSLGDPRLLASGISKALVTTAFGLFVAIPTLFFFHTFRLRTNYLATILEQEASTLTNAWMLDQADAGRASSATGATATPRPATPAQATGQEGKGHEG